MRTEVVLPLGLCALVLALASLGHAASVKLADPAAVDCRWTQWSQWSSCDPCWKTKRRSRSVEVFGQFGGYSCHGGVGDRQFCVPETPCDSPPPASCPDTDFQCESGSCIKKTLMCNGDYDCEDGSDEECDTGRRPCGTLELDTNEQSRTAGYGVTVLGAGPRMNPFNNDYFNGRCDRVKNPYTGKNDRLPWNVGVFNYQTHVEETVSREIYEDTHSLMREMVREMSQEFNAGLSFKFNLGEAPLTNFTNASVKFQKEQKTMIKQMSELTTIENKSFLRVKGRVEMSTYRMRSRKLQVADEFLEHVKSLPVEYEKGIYFAFVEEYGTHYTKNGKSGGEYELIYVLDQNTIKARNLTERSVQECFKLGISASLTIVPKINATVPLNLNKCNNLSSIEKGNVEGKALVDQVLTSVIGGTLNSAATMRAKLNQDGQMDIATYQEWARSIPDLPALLFSEPEPIHMLIPLEMPDANAKISNLRQATLDYVAEYNLCKCRPCLNGGTLTLLDGQCICLCPHLFQGLACQNYKGDDAKHQGPRPSVIQEGNWSCWSAWSRCNEGRRSRTRGCNTVGLLGASCRGDTDSEEAC